MFRSIAIAAAGLVLAACSKEEVPENGVVEQAKLPPASQDTSGTTPMRDRIAVIGLLNKRNGIVRDITLKPGQSIRVKDIIVRLRACEATAPWEEEKLTGAFIQVDVQRTDKDWNRVFSGWVYKESPSLNVVEHPVYDVWPKSCAMSFPDGPAAPAAPSASSRTSSAPKSASGNASAPAPEPAEPPTESVPSAAANNAT